MLIRWGSGPPSPRAARASRLVLAGLLWAAGLGSGGCRVPVPFARQLLFSRSPGVAPSARDCERCHLEVYEEWEGSLHARAWTSEAFQTASAQGRADECLGCHAPAPLPERGAVRVRSAHRLEGVTCTSCHMAQGDGVQPLTMRGPVSRSSPVEVHPVFAEDPLYRSSELCGRCHEGAFAEWRSSADPPDGSEKQTCQECHMPEVSRRVESVHPDHAYSALFVALERKESLRRHLFAVPEDAAEHVRISVLAPPAGSPPALRVRVENRLPHALPTGRFGRRRVRVVAEWEGTRAALPLDRALGEAIPAGATRDLTLSLPASARGAPRSVRLERWDHRVAGWTAIASSLDRTAAARP